MSRFILLKAQSNTSMSSLLFLIQLKFLIVEKPGPNQNSSHFYYFILFFSSISTFSHFFTSFRVHIFWSDFYCLFVFLMDSYSHDKHHWSTNQNPYPWFRFSLIHFLFRESNLSSIWYVLVRFINILIYFLDWSILNNFQVFESRCQID